VSERTNARLWYLERGLAAAPRDAEFLLQLAEARARHGDWKKSAALYERFAANGPVPLAICYQHALVCLRAGEMDGYRKICSRLLASMPEPGPRLDPNTANSVAMLCAVGPGAVSDYSRPLALIDHSLKWLDGVKEQPGAEALFRKVRHAWLNTRSAVLYRDGQHDQAVRGLDQAIAIHGAGGAEDWVLLAMAHHRLGHVEEAKKWLDRVRSVQPSRESRRFWENLEVELLRSEAERLLK
jgi:tetratricopeptide (TPR) repeat protein